MSSKEEINNWLQGDRKAETSAPRAVIRVITLHDFCSCMVVFIFSLGEGSGSPLQCSRLENPREGGAWWAAVYGVTQSRTRLKRLSSSSSSILFQWVPPSPLLICAHKSVVYLCVSVCALQMRSSVPFFWILCICVNIWYLFFSFWMRVVLNH